MQYTNPNIKQSLADGRSSNIPSATAGSVYEDILRSRPMGSQRERHRSLEWSQLGMRDDQMTIATSIMTMMATMTITTIRMKMCVCFLGIFFVLPCIESYTKVDLRTVSFDVPPQEVKQSISNEWNSLFSQSFSFVLVHVCIRTLKLRILKYLTKSLSITESKG